MTIETISLCNITSFAGEFTVDFTVSPLREAGLFAVTGDTGAGKSTLLDAICLALYGTAPRLENIEKMSKKDLSDVGNEITDPAPHDARSFLRRSCREGWVRVGFVTPDRRRYEAEWRVSINGKGNYRRAERLLNEIASKGEKTMIASGPKEVDETVVRLIGLDYEQFSRTVILAQNSFANFLKADTHEKSVLLEKLTGTKIYGRISTRIFELEREARQEVDRLESGCEGASRGLLNEADVREKTERVQLLQTDIKSHRGHQQEIRQLLHWYDLHDAARQELEQSTALHNEVNKNYLAMRSQELLLERYDSVQSFRTPFEQIRELKNVIENIKQSENDAVRKTEEQAKLLEQLRQQMVTAEERKSGAEKQIRIKSADIAMGYALEGEIKSLESAQTEAERMLSTTEKRQLERETTLRNALRDEENTKQHIETLYLRHQELEIHKCMFDHFQNITEKLATFIEEQKKNEHLHASYAADTHQANELSHLSGDARRSLQELSDRRDGVRAASRVHRQAIEGQEASQLHRADSEARQRRTLLIEAKRTWQHIVEGYVRIEELRADIERTGRQIEQRKSEGQACEREEQRRYERFMQLNQAFTLSQSQEIKRLRQELKEGMPCPVCGSAHHPYHTEVEQESGNTQTQLETDYREAEKEYKNQHQTLENLRQEIIILQAAFDNLKTTFAQTRAQQQTLEKDWESFAALDSSFRGCSPTVNRDARTMTIEMLLDSVERQIKESEQQIEIFDFHTREIRQFSDQLASLDNEVEQMQKKADRLETDLKLTNERIDLTYRIMGESDARTEQLYRDLDDVLTLGGWKESDYEEYSKRLTELYTEWQGLNAEINRAENERNNIAAHIEALQTELSDLRVESNSAREKKDRLRESITERRDHLRRLFGERTPSETAAGLQRQWDEYVALYDEVHRRFEQQQALLQHLQGSRANLASERHRNEDLLRQRSTALDQDITRYNLEHTPLQMSELAQLFTDSRDWNALRNKIDSCRRELLITEQNRDRAQSHFLDLEGQTGRPTERDEDKPEVLRSTLEVVEREINVLQEELSEISRALQRHEDSIKDAEAYRSQIVVAQENALEWARLKDLFGSSDGKRFRDLAQSYTFSLLVEHANYHLKMLTPRYQLRVFKGTLALEVIDHDMLEEHRFVNSLSGGETFIVSLALALGLASLSATTLNIGSLFIDEGFGNLDDDSLDMVLSTLSALQAGQGRKVGVVSHTDQIKDQIRPQIRVEKTGTGGRSTLRIF